MKTRPPIPHRTRKAVISENAGRCCVCRRFGLGLDIHHIDGDPYNNKKDNLAPLCVQDHDTHHRPTAYRSKPELSHLDLGAMTISEKKKEWEEFVRLARDSPPLVHATVTAYGNQELIHSAKLVVHTNTGKICYEQVYHLHEGDFDQWADSILEDVIDLSKEIPLSLISEPMPIEQCPSCKKSMSRMASEGVILRSTHPEWGSKSFCSIYINPSQPSLAVVVFFDTKTVFSWGLHLCQGKYLHVHTSTYDDRIRVNRRRSVRSQVTKLVDHVLKEWSPRLVFIGTGDPDKPDLIHNLALPRLWERKR